MVHGHSLQYVEKQLRGREGVQYDTGRKKLIVIFDTWSGGMIGMLGTSIMLCMCKTSAIGR